MATVCEPRLSMYRRPDDPEKRLLDIASVPRRCQSAAIASWSRQGAKSGGEQRENVDANCSSQPQSHLIENRLSAAGDLVDASYRETEWLPVFDYFPAMDV